MDEFTRDASGYGYGYGYGGMMGGFDNIYRYTKQWSGE